MFIAQYYDIYNFMANSVNPLELKTRFNRPKLTAGAAAIALFLSGCGTGGKKPAAESASTTSKSQPAALIPNLSMFLKPGSSTTCYDGGARPCAVLVRSKPELSSSYLNASPSQGEVSWPLEAYRNKTGDKVKIECYTAKGQTITPYEGSSSSPDWYKVMVPEQHIKNPAFQKNGVSAILGWASIEWFGESTPNPEIPKC